MRSHRLLTPFFRFPPIFAPTSESTSVLSSSDHSLNPCIQFLKPIIQSGQLVCLLRSISQNNSVLHCSKQIHAQIIVSGQESDTSITNELFNLYTKSGFLFLAHKLFDRMPERGLVSWSSIVSMYSKHGLGEEALLMFLDFNRCCDESPNEFILASVVRACLQVGFGWGIIEQMHCFSVKVGLDQNVYVGTSLVDLYAKTDDMDAAKIVFDGLLEKSAVSWTAIITGCVRSGKSELALQLFSQMREIEISPDRYLLSSVLRACSQLEFIEGGKEIHGHLLRRGIGVNVSVVNMLINFYTKCGKVKSARKLFDEMVDRSVITWTAMIAGYMQNSYDREAVNLFVTMTRLDKKPDQFVCTSILSSCGSLEALDLGRQVHSCSIKGNFKSDLFLQNGLIDMYAKCNSLNDARKVFDDMSNRNIISYNALIEGYSMQELLSEAMSLFREMRRRMMSPSVITFASLLGASASLSDLKSGRQIHALIAKFGVSTEIFVGSTLIDFYSKCLCVMEARLVFDGITEKDIVVWNAMLFGYTQQLENEEALKVYFELKSSEQKPNDFTFAAITTTASNMGSLHHGQQFHNHIIKTGLDSNPFVTNSITDMYAKCGCLEDARIAFGSVSNRDVTCWNSLILAYAYHGKPKEALRMFEAMIKDGINPDYVTFIGILSACAHAGHVEDGLHYFKSMPKFGTKPGAEHYACIVSLLGRAGKLYKAKEFIDKMPIKPEGVVWRSLLSACRTSGNIKLAKYAAEMAISIDPTDGRAYTLLSNVYASEGMWVDVKKVREKMDGFGVVKEAGRSWIQVNNATHTFIARDKDHCKTQVIYSVVHYLILHIKESGHMLFDISQGID